MDAGNAVVADDACVGAPERGPAPAEKREPNPVALLLGLSREAAHAFVADFERFFHAGYETIMSPQPS